MQSYQKVGLAGGVLTLVVSVLFAVFSSVILSNAMARGVYRTMPIIGAHGSRAALGMPFAIFFGVALIGIIAGVLGIVGAGVHSNVGGGVLLIIGAILSLPMFFGVFGIGFVLMLIGGVLGLASRSYRPTERVVTYQQQPQSQPPPPPPAPTA